MNVDFESLNCQIGEKKGPVNVGIEILNWKIGEKNGTTTWELRFSFRY